MSLYIMPLFERIQVFHEDGTDAGYVLRRCRLAPGDVLMPPGSDFRAAIALMKEAEDDARFD